MEKYLLKLFKLADELNEKKENVYAEIKYSAGNQKKIKISIIHKKTLEYIESCEILLKRNSSSSWEKLIDLFEFYVTGGINNE